MPVALFMKVDGGTGESKNSVYKQWTECEEVNWGVDQPAAITGGGLGAGKAAFRDTIVTSKIDKVFPAMMIKCATGEHISKVEIAGAKAGGDQVEYFKCTLEDVLVTSCGLRGVNGAELLATYAFQAAKIKDEYSEQTEKGAKGATSTFSFNIKENKKA